jgi:Outer membrane protein beta-barrel domain
MRKDGLLVAGLFSLALSIPCTWADEPLRQPTIGIGDEPSEIIKEPTAAQEPLTTLPNKNGRVEQQVAERKRSGDGLTKEELEAAGVTIVEAKQHPLGWVFGFRAGIAIPTQKNIQEFGNSTSIGPLINVEGLYAIKEWLRVGLMVEWHQHSIKMWGPEFGTLDTVSILPTIEFRPTRAYLEDHGLRAVIPYGSLGLGVNTNSISKGSGLPSTASVSFDNTLAFRIGGGLDIPITSNLALNGELAWNRNSGDFQLNSTTGSFNASTLNLMVGIRAQF